MNHLSRSVIWEIEPEFSAWLDAMPWGQVPADVVAYNLNLYELPSGFAIELIGALSYDPNDDDWACEAVFSSRPRNFELSHSVIGSDWHRALSLIAELVRTYVLDQNNAGETLRRAEAVTVGFVNGNLIRVWPLARRS